MPLRVLALLSLAGVFVVLALGETAGAALACRQQVIDDWSDNGRVDRVYPLDCYQQAIEAMPPDIRDYTDAHDSIERALTLAVRGTTGVRPAHNKPARALAAVHPIDTSGSPTIPLPLIALGALAGTALAAGALSYAFRRATLGRRSDAR